VIRAQYLHVPVGQKLEGAALSSLRRPLIRQIHILDGAHDDGRQQASPRVVGAIVRYSCHACVTPSLSLLRLRLIFCLSPGSKPGNKPGRKPPPSISGL
jgi:hypothetical protein